MLKNSLKKEMVTLIILFLILLQSSVTTSKSPNEDKLLSVKQGSSKIKVEDYYSPYYKESISDSNFSYIIITTEIFVDGCFQHLIDFKNEYISSALFTIEEIVDNPDFWVNGTWGDNNPNNMYVENLIPAEYCELFNDTPAKIRNFIRFAKNALNVKFVLLGGDVEIIPTRFLWASIPNWYNGHEYESKEDYISSDVYYACLDGNWNDDFDARFGEDIGNSTDDEADFIAEVYIGRAPVNQRSEVINFIYKLDTYETQEKPSVITLHQSGINSQNVPDSTDIPKNCSKWISSDYHIDRLFANETKITRDDWINRFVEGRLIIAHVGNGVETRYQLDNMNYLLPYYWAVNDTMQLFNSFYPIHFSLACHSGNFSYRDCIAEELILKQSGGASACVFNSNVGCTSQKNAHKYSGEFMEQQFFQIFYKGTNNLGMAIQLAKEKFIFEAVRDPNYRWCYYTINLLGDPETPILGEKRTSNLPTLVWVDDDFNSSTAGWNETHFNVIQRAIEKVAVNQTAHINVLPGLYYENVVIRKKIFLTGANKENTIIDGRDFDDAIKIEADNVYVSGFTIQNSGHNNSGGYIFDSGIHVISNHNRIYDNNISYNEMGIVVEGVDENKIAYNKIDKNRRDGISLFLNAKNNEIYKNILENSGEVGIFVYSSRFNLIKENYFANCEIGIYLVDSSIFNRISYNYISNMRYNYLFARPTGCAIMLDYFCCFNRISGNDIIDNEKYGIILRFNCILNRICYNDFINNSRNAHFINCIWNDWVENYWDNKPSILPYYIIIGRLGFIPMFNGDWAALKVPWTYPSP